LDHYSIVDPTTSTDVQTTASPSSNPKLEVTSPAPVHLPGDDSGKSLTDMAQRDLEAALQLLAERAQYITGASGAAIALLEDDEMICRASAGPSAPELGAEVQVKTGLTGESVRTRQVLRCDDAETDSRVNRESCRSLGIRSVMVMPLLRDQEVLGVFELMADRPQAFEERDITALERLAEMVLTGLEHADAAKRALKEIASKNEEAVAKQVAQQKESEPVAAVTDVKESLSDAASPKAAPDEPVATKAVEPKTVEPKTQIIDKIRKCEACGFPVSEGRTLCLDCEATRLSAEGAAVSASNEAPAFLSQFGDQGRQQNWLQAHFYTIGTILMIALTLVLLALRLR
jgi:putative methionine-R-sulfoxide reductase with GAF domain